MLTASLSFGNTNTIQKQIETQTTEFMCKQTAKHQSKNQIKLDECHYSDESVKRLANGSFSNPIIRTE